MNRSIFRIFILFATTLSCSNVFGQLKEFSQNQYHFLFSYKSDSYLTLDDSIYCVSGAKEGFPRVNDFAMKEFKFVANDSIGFLKNASSGVVYSFDGTDFIRLDNSFPFKSQYSSFSFIHDNKLMDFGGYGLFTFKNILTYFSLNKKETELYRVKTPISEMPSPRHIIIAQYVGGDLYMGAGLGYPLDKEYPFNEKVILNDYWKFSFNSEEWERLGEGVSGLPSLYSPLHQYNGNTLLISDVGLYEYDIQNNLLINYPKADTDILNTLNVNRTLIDITYNTTLEGFFMVINKQDRNAGVIFVKRDELLGTEKVITKIYEVKETFNAMLLLGSFGFLFFAVTAGIVYNRKKKPIANLLLSMEEELESELKKEDFIVLMKIASANPEYVNYTDLVDAYPDYLGYESKKKKLRLSLVFLEGYLEQKLKIKSPVFKIRKNIEDKREKQVKLK